MLVLHFPTVECPVPNLGPVFVSPHASGGYSACAVDHATADDPGNSLRTDGLPLREREPGLRRRIRPLAQRQDAAHGSLVVHPGENRTWDSPALGLRARSEAVHEGGIVEEIQPARP